jgi:hypothetical protein
VRLDVLRRFVSIEKARSDYGVVIDPETLGVDDRGTASLRQELRQRRPQARDLFDFGDRSRTPVEAGAREL